MPYIDYEKSRQVEGGYLTAINMTESKHAFKLAEGENKDTAVFLGLEWEVKIKGGARTHQGYYGSSASVTKFGKFIKKVVASPVGDYVNFRSDANLLEMVTIPATLNAHKEYMEAELFKSGINKFIGKHGVRTSAGIHIHVDKKAFTDANHVTRFAKFLRHNEVDSKKFMRAIADRAPNQYAANRSLPIKINSQTYADHNHAGKYQAVNTTHWAGKTIEVRLFNSVQKKTKLYARLEFMDAIVRYTKVENNPLTVKDFTRFIKLNEVRYPNLNKESYVKRELKVS